MGSEKQTAVNLTRCAQGLKNQLEAVYKLKLLVSAGFILLDSLPPKDREDLIKIVATDNEDAIKAVLDEYAALFASKGSKRR